MRLFRRAGFWLATFGLLATAGVRAAVMTTDVQVVGGGPFDIKYVLGQDVTSLKIDIVRASDSTAVKTWDSAVAGTFQAADLLKGQHNLTGFWDGKANGGATLPTANYYARVTTASTNAIAAMTLLSGPTPFAFQSGRSQARNIYGGGANRVASSPYHNIAYFGVCTSGNAAASAGVDAVSANASSICFPIGNLANSYDFVSAGMMSDGFPVVGSQSTNALRIINPGDGSTVGTDLSLGASPRSIVGVGDSTSGKIFYLDGSLGGVKAWDLALATPVDEIPDASNFAFYETSPGVPGCTTPQRGMAVSADGNTVWASGSALSSTSTGCLPTGQTSVVLPAFVAKYVRSGGSWTRTDFTANIPGLNRLLTSNNLRGLALSPDESILWVAINNVGTGQAANNYVIGLDAQTGLPKGAAYTYNFFTGTTVTGTPQGLAVAGNGDIYVSCWNGAVTGTTAYYVAVLAPPDNGSTDVTRSVTYNIGPPVLATVDPSVGPITYHSGTVTWSTDSPSDSTVKYGLAPGTLSSTVTAAALVTDHSLLMEGLTQNTKYYYQVVSAATGQKSYTSAVLDFTTTGLNISNVATTVTENSVKIGWDTDDYSNSWGNIGLDGATYPIRYGTDTVSTASMSHTIWVRGLKPSTVYHYKVETGWPGAPAVYTTDATFKTLDYVQIAGESLVTDTSSATLSFTTNIAAAATVKYGTDPATLSNTLSVPSGTAHTVTFPSLAAGTTYYYTLDLTGGTSVARTTSVSAFTTQVVGSAATTITDNTTDKFANTWLTQLTVGGAGGLLTLDPQLLPGQPVQGPATGTPTRYQGFALLNGYLYILGGDTSTSYTITDKVFYAKINADGTIGTWAATTPLPNGGRYIITSQCVGYNNTLYVVSGDDSTNTVTTEVFYAKQNADGTLGSWVVAPPTPGDREIATVTIIDGKIVLNGGEDNNATSDGYSYADNFVADIKADGSLGPWYSTTPFTEPIYLNRVISNDHKMYSVGGLNDRDYPDVNHRFTGTVDTQWIEPNSGLTPGYRHTYDPAHLDATMDGNHYSMGAAMVGGKIFTFGGRIDATAAYKRISHTKLSADGLTSKWVIDAGDTATTALPIAIRDNEALRYGNFVYISPGRTDAGPSDIPQVVPMVADAAGGYAYSGTVESRVIDLGSVLNLSHIKVTGTGVTSSSVDVRYRYAGANGDFSDYLLAGPDTDIAGGARYVQYELVLKGDGTTTPVVNSVVLNAGAVPAVPGDINKDGVVDAKDVKLALQIAAGLLNANDPSVSFTNGNVVADSVINVLDALAIQRKINGK